MGLGKFVKGIGKVASAVGKYTPARFMPGATGTITRISGGALQGQGLKEIASSELRTQGQNAIGAGAILAGIYGGQALAGLGGKAAAAIPEIPGVSLSSLKMTPTTALPRAADTIRGIAGGGGASGGSAAAGAGGSMIRRVGGGIANFLGDHAGDLLGLGSLYSGLQHDRRAGKMEDEMLGMARDQWNSQAPLREMGMRGMMSEERPDLSATFANPSNPFDASHRAAPAPRPSRIRRVRGGAV